MAAAAALAVAVTVTVAVLVMVMVAVTVCRPVEAPPPRGQMNGGAGGGRVLRER